MAPSILKERNLASIKYTGANYADILQLAKEGNAEEMEKKLKAIRIIAESSLQWWWWWSAEDEVATVLNATDEKKGLDGTDAHLQERARAVHPRVTQGESQPKRYKQEQCHRTHLSMHLRTREVCTLPLAHRRKSRCERRVGRYATKDCRMKRVLHHMCAHLRKHSARIRREDE